MKKNRKAQWIALAIAASCAGCSTGSGAKSPGFFANWTNPLSSFMAQSKPPAAKEVEDQLRVDNKVTPTAEFFLAAGALAESRGDNQTAMDQYTRAIKNEPKNVKAHLHLARLHDRLEQYPQAEAAYSAAITAAPTDPMPLSDYAMCLAKQGRFDDSIANLQKAIYLRPNQTSLRTNIADVLVRAGRPREAFDHLAVVHSVAESHYNLGVLLRRVGEVQPAREQFVAALQVDSNLTAAQAHLDELGGQPSESFQQATRPATKEVSAPRSLRAQAPSQETTLEAEETEGGVPPIKTAPKGGYYQGIEEGDEKAAPPAEVLAKKPKPARKSSSELRAKIEDTPAKIR